MALKILYRTIKIFYVSNQLFLCPFLRDDAKLSPWMQFMKEILDMQIPPEMEAFTEDINEIAEKDQSIWWKIKAQASLTTFRLFQKYAVTQYVKHDPEQLAYNEKF